MANLELEEKEDIPYEEDPFGDLDFGSMTEDEKNFINQLQDTWKTALETGNDVAAEWILNAIEDFKNGLGDEYIQIGKDVLVAMTTPFGKVSNSKLDTDEHISDLEKQLEMAKEAGASGRSVIIGSDKTQ